MSQLLGTGYQRAGKNSRIEIGTTILAMSSWDITENGDDLDTANFTSAGLSQASPNSTAFGEGILGFQQIAWNLGGNWDAHMAMYDDPPGLYVRDDLGLVKFFENVNDNDYVFMNYARVRSSNNGAEVKGLVTFKASGMSNGPYTLPVSSV